MALCPLQFTYYCEYRLKSRRMHEHDRCEDADVDDETNQRLRRDLCRLRQGIGHAVEGREDG